MKRAMILVGMLAFCVASVTAADWHKTAPPKPYQVRFWVGVNATEHGVLPKFDLEVRRGRYGLKLDIGGIRVQRAECIGASFCAALHGTPTGTWQHPSSGWYQPPVAPTVGNGVTDEKVIGLTFSWTLTQLKK